MPLRRRPSLASAAFLASAACCLVVDDPRSALTLAHAFAPGARSPRRSHRGPPATATTWRIMARGGVHGKKTRMIQAARKKKKKTKKRDPLHRPAKGKRKRDDDASAGEGGGKSGKRAPASSSPATRPKLAIPGGNRKRASGPPWQVMGQKDVTKHVAAERERRERIRSGLDPPSSGGGSADRGGAFRRADVSGSNRLLSAPDRAMLGWRRFNPQAAPSDLTMVGAYLGTERAPSLGVPEVAFLGRSNVGKSSLLNRLAARAGGDTARVGKTPGATASVNLYALLGRRKRRGGDSFRSAAGGGEARPLLGFADLPGFGYAKLSKETKENVEEAAERYLGRRRELALGVLLVDARREPNADDRAVLAALYDMGVPLVVVATKSDKLRVSEVESAMATVREGLGLPDGQPLRASGVTGEGVRELWRIVLDACETRVGELKRAMEEGRDDGGAMRMALGGDEEGGDDFYDAFEEGFEEEAEYLDDEDDVVYDQGYDWVQGETDAGGGAHAFDDFYDGDGFVEYEDEDDDDAFGEEETNWNEERQRMEKESFKLKNLKSRVAEMERRGEI